MKLMSKQRIIFGHLKKKKKEFNVKWDTFTRKTKAYSFFPPIQQDVKYIIFNFNVLISRPTDQVHEQEESHFTLWFNSLF